MQTIKTATVVILFLAVLYGVYVVLNKPAWPPDHPLSWKSDDGDWSQGDDELDPVRVQIRSDDASTGQGELVNGDGFTSFRSKEKNEEGLPRVEITTRDLADSKSASHRSLTDLASTTEPPIAPPSFLPSPQESGVPEAVPTAETGETPATERPHPDATLSAYAGQDKSEPGKSERLSPPTFDESNEVETKLLPSPGDRRTITDQQPTNPAGASEFANDEPNAAHDNDAPSAAGKPNSSNAIKLSDADHEATETEPSQDTPSMKAIRPFERAVTSARLKLEAGQFYESLLTLSVFYDNTDLTADEHQQLLDYLDPLAAKVVYSTEHVLEAPHKVADGETLATIAAKYSVPIELLQNINGIDDPNQLPPGTTLKVVTGPFRAEINRERKELTLFVKRLYAGRFPVTIAEGVEIEPGEYQITEKAPGRIFVAADGTTIPAEDPRNPYGGVWLGLSDNLSLHGTPARSDGNSPVSIGLSRTHAVDLYGILSEGSHVTVE